LGTNEYNKKRDVYQLARLPDLGSGGREFEFHRPDKL